MNENNKISIVTFGDSLTVGYQSPTAENPFYHETPYADFLKEKMGDRAEFIIKGISGELTEEMVLRFEGDVVTFSPDYVVILGGSNDIGWGIQPEKVMGNLLLMYNSALSSGIKPVSVTVPSILGFDSLIPVRQVLNSMIKEKSTSIKVPCVDFFTASAEKETLRLGREYSNDGLHLSTAGYKLLADLLYNEIFSRM